METEEYRLMRRYAGGAEPNSAEITRIILKPGESNG
jgi:hypothetical protein